jgi:hypothetical protein
MATRKSRKGGYVYFGRSERKNGSVQEYVGSTTRTVTIREKEHKREVRKSNSKTWVGKGTTFKVTDSFYSSNPRKAEATIKRKRKSAYKSGNYRSKYSGQKAKRSSTRSNSSSNYYRPKRSSGRRQRS